MNDLERFFANHTGRKVVKWDHYLDIYDRYFSRYRGTEVHIVEIGVNNGGSLQMWKDYFGPEAHIYGVDINPACKAFEEERIQIFIGDQSDQAFLRELSAAIPKIDILIDDGGHEGPQQIPTYEILFPRIEPDGIYLCEDVSTSYWPEFGGGYERDGTFIEYAKGFVDQLHAWHSKEPERLAVSDFTRSVVGVYFHDSIVVVEKGPRTEPEMIRSGKATLRPKSMLGRIKKGLGKVTKRR